MDYRPKRLVDLITAELTPEPAWIGPNILPKGGLWLVGGAAKVAKSFISLEVARALATGTRPFDSHYFSVNKPARVLLCEQEVGEIGLQKRSQTAMARHPLYHIEDNIWYLSKIPELQLSTTEGRKILFDACEEIKPNVVILDPISKFHGYDENDNSQIEEMFRRLAQLRSEFAHLDMAHIITHHFRKPNKVGPYDALDPYNFAGSRKWFDSPDTITTIERREMLKDRSGWIIRTRWNLRHGENPEDMDFIVKPGDEDGQVKFYKNAEDDERLPTRTKLPNPAPAAKQTKFVFSTKKEI